MKEPLSRTRHDRTDVFEKRINDHWTLRKFAHARIGAPPGRGCYYDEHELWNPRSGAVIPATDWEWADIDRDRLAWVADGRLHVGRVGSQGLGNSRMILDFRDMTYRELEAPY